MSIYHLYLGGLNTDAPYWNIGLIDTYGKEILGYAAKEVKIHVPSWTLHIPEKKRWVLVCQGIIQGPPNDGHLKDLYEIVKEKQ